eukprot:scaffold103557_cov33-Phaeocystis_antarctica.AAC.1
MALGIGHGAWGMSIGHWALGIGHWAWGIGHGAWGMGHGALVCHSRVPALPCTEPPSAGSARVAAPRARSLWRRRYRPPSYSSSLRTRWRCTSGRCGSLSARPF